jgi:hypothetical protein
MLLTYYDRIAIKTLLRRNSQPERRRLAALRGVRRSR